MPRLKVAVSQTHTLATTKATLAALTRTVRAAADQGAHLILFPEAYIGGYPRGADFGSAVGSRSDAGREQFLQYFKGAADLGDTPDGGGDAWVERRLGAGADEARGDGTREALERAARDAGVFVVVGVIERAGGSLYCTAVYVDPERGCVGKRRKVMPTATERLVWAQGSPATLKAVRADLAGHDVRLAAAICWENYMPLLRFSLYSQDVNIYLAPTADNRPTWVPLMQTIALEGRAFVLSANQCLRRRDLASWVGGGGSGSEHAVTNGDTPGEVSPTLSARRRRTSVTVASGPHELSLPAISDETDDPAAFQVPPQRDFVPKLVPAASRPAGDPMEFVSRGGSCIVAPTGEVVAGPLWEDPDGLLVAEIDLDDCIRGKLDFDAAGSYSRSDSFKLSVEGLSLSPP